MWTTLPVWSDHRVGCGPTTESAGRRDDRSPDAQMVRAEAAAAAEADHGEPDGAAAGEGADHRGPPGDRETPYAALGVRLHRRRRGVRDQPAPGAPAVRGDGAAALDPA